MFKLAMNTTQLPPSWSKNTNTSFYKVAQVSLFLQYISFIITVLMSIYLLYLSVDSMKYSKRLSNNYLAMAVILLVMSFIMLMLVRLNPTVAVAVLTLEVLMFVIRERIIERTMNFLNR